MKHGFDKMEKLQEEAGCCHLICLSFCISDCGNCAGEGIGSVVMTSRVGRQHFDAEKGQSLQASASEMDSMDNIAS